MSKLAELREKRAGLVSEMRTLHDKAANENRDMSADEGTRFDTLKTEERSVAKQIERAEALAEMERRSDAAPLDEQGRETRSFSVAKAIQESMTGRLTGREAEVNAELSRGRETRGVMIPTAALLEHRAVTTFSPNNGDGGLLVGRQTMPVTEHTRPLLLVEGLGATVMRDLVGNVDLPRMVESGSVSWVAEHTDAVRSDPKFASASMSPKTVAGEYEVSRRMILQSSTAIEELLRRDLGILLRQALDGAAINGRDGREPLGILNTPGIKKVFTSPLLSDTTAELISSLEMDDFTGTQGFLTSPKVALMARKVRDSEGRSIPISEVFHGFAPSFTNQVPANRGDKSDKSALIYGQWSELVIGYWSGVDILVNPYHSAVASKGGVLIHAFLDADVVVREPKAFAYAEV